MKPLIDFESSQSRKHRYDTEHVEFFSTAVQAVNDSRGNTSVSPDLRTCCACRACQHACDGLAFKFTEQMSDSELPLGTLVAQNSAPFLLTRFIFLTIYWIEILSTTFSQILFFL